MIVYENEEEKKTPASSRGLGFPQSRTLQEGPRLRLRKTVRTGAWRRAEREENSDSGAAWKRAIKCRAKLVRTDGGGRTRQRQ